MVATLALHAADIVFHPIPAGMSEMLQKYGPSVVFFAAAALCVTKGRAATHERIEWGLFALAMVLWGTASTYYAIALWNLDAVPVPSIADGFWIAFYVPAYIAISRLLRKRAGSFGKGAWLDAVIGALGVGSAAALLVFQAVLERTAGTPIAVVTNLAYPIGDLGLVALLVAAMTMLGWKSAGVLRWIAPAFGLFAVADSIYLVRVADATYEPGGMVDLGWPAAAVLVGFAAWRAESPLPSVARSSPVIVIPTAVGLSALVFLVFDHFISTSALTLALATSSLAVILVRLHLSLRENAALLERSRREATSDALTGLGNRRQLASDLSAHLERLDASRPLELTLFDLDGFKQYNDTFGHPAGDQLLERLSRALSDLLAGCGTAYRMGGDEFCTLWYRDDAELASVSSEDAARALSEHGDGFSITCSHGSVLLPTETTDAPEALRMADRSMYQRKRSGRASAARQSADVLLSALAERWSVLGDSLDEVGDLASMTATELGGSAADVELTRQTALLRDVGKVAIPDEILNKAGSLDDAERAFIRRHTIIGERIISAAPSLAIVAKLVGATQEFYDGRGYPDGLAGDDIPLIARIIAICDAYEAMVTPRAGRSPRGACEAVQELRRCAGTQFDPRVVEAFVLALAAVQARAPSEALAATP
jgi:diguanylate cyclase (GGDEF)-like protein